MSDVAREAVTPATLKTLREAMNLPVAWLAAQANVQERTVRYWESGRNEVPDDVERLISALWRQLNESANQALREIRRIVGEQGKPAEPILLVRYRTDQELWKYRHDLKGLPTNYHGAICARVIAESPAAAIAEWLDADAYEDWRRATKQKDSEGLRAQFIAQPASAR